MNQTLMLRSDKIGRFQMVEVIGDKMLPQPYKEGDYVVADTTRRNFNHGGVFCLDLRKCKGSSIVKLCPKINGKIDVISEDQRYSYEADPKHIEKALIGQVVGFMKREAILN